MDRGVSSEIVPSEGDAVFRDRFRRDTGRCGMTAGADRRMT